MLVVKSNINEELEKAMAKLSTFEVGGSGSDLAMRAGMVTILPVIKQRIHEKGLDGNNTKIGQYSTEPIYVNPKNSPRKFSPQGKHGDTKFRSGEPHQTRYFEDGYKGFKTFIGRNLLGSVNLSLTGGLSNQTVVIPTDKGYGIGFSNDENLQRAKALEKKYQKAIWTKMTAEESTIFADAVIERLTEIYGRD